MKKFLFQGDSITDANRFRDAEKSLGQGYPVTVAATLGTAHPGELEFVNKGISGNRIVDVYARIKKDIINLKPDYMSILIGVNDVWHELAAQNGVDAEKFEKIYSMLIEEIKEALPELKIIVLAPFVTAGTATDEKLDTFRTEVAKRAEAAKRVAEKYGLTYVTLQDKFNAAIEKAPADYWTADGVHPTSMGHGIIAKAVIDAFEKL